MLSKTVAPTAIPANSPTCGAAKELMCFEKEKEKVK